MQGFTLLDLSQAAKSIRHLGLATQGGAGHCGPIDINKLCATTAGYPSSSQFRERARPPLALPVLPPSAQMSGNHPKVGFAWELCTEGVCDVFG